MGQSAHILPIVYTLKRESNEDSQRIGLKHEKCGARFWYVIFQISRDLIPAAYENEKNSLFFLD